jgi:hypothetical protein
MISRSIVVALILGMCVPLVYSGAEANREAEAQAVEAAEAWLALVDEGDYLESWNTASDLFKGAVSREQWNQSLEAVRKPLGRVIVRALESKTYTTALPGAPDGEYVVLQYKTSFENKASAVETITPMLDRDGHWRVSGYYIR